MSNKPKYYDSMRLEHLSGQFFHTVMKPLKKNTAYEACEDSKLIMMCNSIAPNVNRHEICHTRNTVFSQIQSDLSQNEITLARVNLWKVCFKKLKKTKQTYQKCHENQEVSILTKVKCQNTANTDIDYNTLSMLLTMFCL